MLEDTLAPGAMVAGRYRVEEEIAEGGMGAVFGVRNVETGEGLALKIIRPRLAKTETLVERFRREARILDALDHPNIVRLRDAGLLDDGAVFVAMERLAGETLLERLKRQGSLDPTALLAVVREIASALDAVAGSGVVHRDLKPSNVFVTVDGCVKLLDFGVARAVELERLTITGHAIGTPSYMAPEQLSGGEVDARTDVYSLGVIAYAALAGRLPYPGRGMADAARIRSGDHEHLSRACPALPAALASAVERAMAVRPDERFTSAGVFVAAFERALVGAGRLSMPTEPVAIELPPTRTGLTVTTDVATTLPYARRPVAAPRAARSRRGFWIGMGVVGVAVPVIAGAILLFAVGGRRPSAEPAPVQERVLVAPVPAREPPAAVDSTPAAPAMVHVDSRPSSIRARHEDGSELGLTPLDLPRPTDPDGYEIRAHRPGTRGGSRSHPPDDTRRARARRTGEGCTAPRRHRPATRRRARSLGELTADGDGHRARGSASAQIHTIKPTDGATTRPSCANEPSSVWRPLVMVASPLAPTRPTVISPAIQNRS